MSTRSISTIPSIDTEWVAAERSCEAEKLLSAGILEPLAGLLANRGVTDAATAQDFLAPSLDQLHPATSLPGMKVAVARLVRARDSKEKVAIVGDYDADGVTATALLVACLGLGRIEVEAILPHRLRDGYGFQARQVERAQELGCQVVVTVDCGMSSAGAVDLASEKGIDVIVTDHHLATDSVPKALAIVNPRLASSGENCYRNPDLCGAGIALKLGVALLEALEVKVPLDALLRIACLGTIADLVPLCGENRSIAALGLEALGAVRSPGLKALMDVAKVRAPVLSEDVGFRIAPRINAAGRLDSPDLALELLLTRDVARGRALAAQLDGLNKQRQAAEREVVDEARDHFLSMRELPRLLVAYNERWHRGVVGIAAGRLAREFHRPTILLQVDGREATGSGRSVSGVHLHGFLMEWRDDLLRFGGHSQAIGLTVELAKLPQLVSLWNQGAQAWPAEALIKRYRYEIETNEVAPLLAELYTTVKSLQPFGQGNPSPLIRVGPLGVAKPPRSFGQGHLDLMVEDTSGGRIRVTGWNWADRSQVFAGRFEMLGRLGWDDYFASPALTLVDAHAL